jgi:hypothetical protein
MAPPSHATGPSVVRYVVYLVLAVLVLSALYVTVVLNWSYSSGERAGWVQKFSKKGWLCKTWEGEIALVSMPGAIPEKFQFTVFDDEVAAEINRHMGRRVSLHYEQKVGLPTTCFGETRYYVTRIMQVDDMQLSPGSSGSIPSPVPRPVPVPPPAGPSAPGSPPATRP